MTTNRLSKSETGPRKSVFRASEWALMAEQKNLKRQAEAWRNADREGWDSDNYDPDAAAEYRRKIAESR
jgi:hypothetical protein